MPRAPTTPKKKATTSVTRNVSGGDNGIVIGGDVVDSVVHNTVNQNIFQKIFINIFKPDTESLDQRNRRILLNHVENFWVKGVLEKSLHGAAMLELGIKEDPEAVTYPWAIKKETTDETLPTGTSMLDIFEQIGMGRSLLILGAPGSGKTTMLLELARQLIERARQNADEPIPMVFNLASWTEKLALADWLAQELNNLYMVPRKTAPDWVKGNKLLLLLDGLDEVQQESRAKCVEAINQFRKEHGLTSLAVCSRSQDYEELGTKLSFDGAIEVQPLTQTLVAAFFNRFGKEMAGLKQVLKKDSALREMAETPLFLSIMVMAYRDKKDIDILVTEDLDAQRTHLFDNYIERMFEHSRSKGINFQQQDVLYWLSFLASKMIERNQIPYLLENMQPIWLIKRSTKSLIEAIAYAAVLESVNDAGGRFSETTLQPLINSIFQRINARVVFPKQSPALSKETPSYLEITISYSDLPLDEKKQIWRYKLLCGIITGLIFGMIGGLIGTLMFELIGMLIGTLMGGVIGGISSAVLTGLMGMEISTVDSISWDWNDVKKPLSSWLAFGLVLGLLGGLINGLIMDRLILGLGYGLVLGLTSAIVNGLHAQQIDRITYPGQRLFLTAKNFVSTFLISGLSVGLIGGLIFGFHNGSNNGLISGLTLGLLGGLAVSLIYGGFAIIQHYSLRFFLAHNNVLPWKLVPFLDYCTDLIFLRRVGGGYIFVHRLLMEHFAAMYKKEESDQRIRSG